MIRVALHHKTTYQYDRHVDLGPQVVRLRPAPHCRTPISAYSLKVTPDDHYLNWQQDPHSNYLARLVFNGAAQTFDVEVNLIANMTVINPFDFFLEPTASEFPFEYEPTLAKDLKPFLEPIKAGPQMFSLLASIDRSMAKTNDFLVSLNQKIQQTVKYLIRMEPGVQSPEETLTLGSGSCRDSAWLLVQVLRQLGLAARFVSGYLIQLKPDVKSLDGPSGTEADFTDLHAWTEVFLPGAGWIGLDPTSGLLAGEGHIPLACTPEPNSAAPITGSVSEAKVKFRHEMSITRIYEDPRVTKPYTDDQWQRIQSLGQDVDAQLIAGDVRLTMGGEPTFVSIDDMDGAEWQFDAIGPTKRGLAVDLISRLRHRFAPHGLIHYGQGKWYPGEPLPRWAFTCLWRTDGQPMWQNDKLLADPNRDYSFEGESALQFSKVLAGRLDVNPEHAVPAFEDALFYLWKERRLPANAELNPEDMSNEDERVRLARLLEMRMGKPVGCLLPLAKGVDGSGGWVSGTWPVKSEFMFLIPGDSPMGLRLPLDSIPDESTADWNPVPATPYAESEPLPNHERLRSQFAFMQRGVARSHAQVIQPQVLQRVGTGVADKSGDVVGRPLAAKRPTETAILISPEACWARKTASTAALYAPRSASKRARDDSTFSCHPPINSRVIWNC